MNGRFTSISNDLVDVFSQRDDSLPFGHALTIPFALRPLFITVILYPRSSWIFGSDYFISLFFNWGIGVYFKHLY
jgi:hypothetical protein